MVTSVICGVAQISADKDFGRLGLKTVLFYSLTGLLAVATGLICVNLLQPGEVEPTHKQQILSNQSADVSSKVDQAMQTADHGWENILQVFHRMVPSNLFDAAVNGQLLGLITFGLLFGFFLGRLKGGTEGNSNEVLVWTANHHSQNYPGNSCVCTNWDFCLGHSHHCQEWTQCFLADGLFCFNRCTCLIRSCSDYPSLLLKYLGRISFHWITTNP